MVKAPRLFSRRYCVSSLSACLELGQTSAGQMPLRNVFEHDRRHERPPKKTVPLHIFRGWNSERDNALLNGRCLSAVPFRRSVHHAPSRSPNLDRAITLRQWTGFTCSAQVPFLDVLNTMLDPSLPLTAQEYDEWGDPAEKAAFKRIRSYSPYDNIKAGARYPAMLVTASLQDTR
jgi:hypothetical protein